MADSGVAGVASAARSEAEQEIRSAIDQWRTGLDAVGEDVGPSMPAFILDALRSMPDIALLSALGFTVAGGGHDSWLGGHFHTVMVRRG